MGVDLGKLEILADHMRGGVIAAYTDSEFQYYRS